MKNLVKYVMVPCMLLLSMFLTDLASTMEALDERRVFGTDRYETSVLMALEQFPDGVDKVILARGETEGAYCDALSAATLAGHYEAPILITQKDALPNVVRDALLELNTAKVYIIGGENAVSNSVGEEIEGLGIETGRVYGDNRFETAVEIAKQAASADYAFIVNGHAPADALVAGPVAYAEKAPILQVTKFTVPEATKQAIEILGVEKVYIIGGDDVIHPSVENELASMVEIMGRSAGQDRYRTSAHFTGVMYERSDDLTVVNGHDANLSDAVGAAAYARPIAYVRHDQVPESVKDLALVTLNPYSELKVIGGNAAISSDVMNELEVYMQATVLTEDDVVDGAEFEGHIQILESGTFGPDSGTAFIAGTLFVDPGIDGEVTLKNVDVSNVVIKSGSENSVNLDDVIVGQELVVHTSDPDNQVRVSIDGSTKIKETVILTNVFLDRTSGSFGHMIVQGLGEKIEVIFNRNEADHTSDEIVIEHLELLSQTDFKLVSGVIELLIISEDAGGTTVTLERGTVVDKAFIYGAPISFEGLGIINEAEIYASPVTFNRLPLSMVCGAGFQNVCNDLRPPHSAPVVTGVQTNPTSLSFDVSWDPQQIDLSAHLSNGSTTNISNEASWSSVDESVATVTDGLVTPAGGGNTTIRAEYEGFSIDVPVDVALILTGLTADQDALVFDGSTGRQTIELTAAYIDGSERDVTDEATWSSDDGQVAVVDNDENKGRVTPVRHGDTSITAAYDGLEADISVSVKVEFSGGDGSDSTPYLIDTAEQLNGLRYYANDADLYFQLEADIDLSGAEFVDDEEGWEPIGNRTNPFRGTFDGNDRTISNLMINRPEGSVQGFFGELSGTVEALHFEDANLTAEILVGVLAGYAIGANIEGVTATGTVTTIETSFGGSNAGGLIGLMSGRSVLADSGANVLVTGVDHNIGGLVGRVASDSEIHTSYAHGNVIGDGSEGQNVGGLVGLLHSGTIMNSYAIGDVSGLKLGFGGLVGTMTFITGTSYDLLIENSYAAGTVSGPNDTSGGLVGMLTAGDISNSYYTDGQYSEGSGKGNHIDEVELGDINTFTDNGWDFPGIWLMSAEENRPILQWEAP